MTTPISLHTRLSPDTIVQMNFNGIDEPRFVLGYASIRCLGVQARMILAASQVSHWIVLYDCLDGPDGTWDKSSWWKDKKILQEENPLVNLPFLIDCQENRVLSQCHAITAYLGREFQLMGGPSNVEQATCEELLYNIYDSRDRMIEFAYGTDLGALVDDAKALLAHVAVHFGRLEASLRLRYGDDSGTSVHHLIPNKCTVADFHLWDILDQYEGLCLRLSIPCYLDVTASGEGYPLLKQFKNSFLKLDLNAPFRTQADALRLPYNSPYARFGSTLDPLKTYERGQTTPWRKRGIVSFSF